MVSIKTLRILADIIFILSLLVFVLFLLKKISFEYMAPIIVIIAAIEMTIFFIFMKKALKDNITDRVPTNKVIVPKAKFIDKFVYANNEILSQNIRPISPSHSSIFRINIEFNSIDKIRDLKFSIIRKYQLNTCEQNIEIKDLNRHVIDLTINPKEIINFKFDKDVILRSFSVDELYIP